MLRFHFVLSAILLLALAIIATAPANAQTATPTPKTIVVTNLNTDGPGSLLEAINNAPSDSLITFDPSLSGILLLRGSSSPIIINSSLTIMGPASRTVILRGAVFFVETGGTLRLKNLELVQNYLQYEKGSVLELADCTSRNNPQFVFGEGTLTIARSIIKDVTIALWVSGSAHITASAFIHNGTAIYVSENASLIVSNSTFSQNETAIANIKGTAKLIQSSIQVIDHGGIVRPIVNRGKLTLSNSIVAVTKDATIKAPERKICESDGTILDLGGNLQYPDTTCGANIPVGDPDFAPLQDNGGPTPTLALLPGSAAIGLGRDCPQTDQRGFLRAGTCDAGAYQSTAAGGGRR